MARVAVVTDTTHYMPRALVADLGLHEVSLYVTFDGATERESDITDLADF
jgi:fatty acid-binding protein DegV